MRFTPSFLDEIRTRLPTSEVVRRRVKLLKAGREWRGLSPFNAEKTPSFYVNDQKMAWFDFSSGKNGNIFDFVMETEGLSFPEAVERLAGEAGLALPVASPEMEAREQRRAGLQEVLELTVQFFEAQLQGREGAKARGYLADRGLTPALQQQFRLGYSLPERFALRDHLASKGARAETMIEAGLLVHGDEIAVPYDRFRDRVMFPIFDRSGRPIAFGGRAMDKTVAAKYLNSPETPLFHKGGVLFNHHRARKAAHERGTVIAVEGYVDVIAMTSVGFPHVVAPLGTALTPDQCGLLWSMSGEPILCFDGDKAGRKAAFRAVDTALPLIGADKTLRFAFLPEGQDPDDLARSGGAAAIQSVLEAAKPLVDVLWMREVEAQPLDTPERKAGLERRLQDLLRTIADETLRRHYRDDIQARLQALRGSAPVRSGYGARQMGGFGGGFGNAMAGGRRRGFGAEPARGYVGAPLMASPGLTRTSMFNKQSAVPVREAGILVIILNHPDLLDRYAEDLAGLELDNRDLARLRTQLLRLATEVPPDSASLRAALVQAGEGDLCLRLEAAVSGTLAATLKLDAPLEAVETALRQALLLHRRARALHNELKQAETALAEIADTASFERLCDIHLELAKLDGREASTEVLLPPGAVQLQAPGLT